MNQDDVQLDPADISQSLSSRLTNLLEENINLHALILKLQRRIAELESAVQSLKNDSLKSDEE